MGGKFYRVDHVSALGKIFFVTRMPVHDLFAVANFVFIRYVALNRTQLTTSYCYYCYYLR